MFNAIFPPTVTNDYHGSPVAKLAFGATKLLTVGRSLVHILKADGGAQSIATVPLDAYPPDASDAVVAIFALWGLSQLLLGLVFLVVLWRYRSLIPLMWLLVLLEWGGRLVLGVCKPIETRETPPGAIGNVVFTVLALVMLPLSLQMKTGKEKGR